MSPFFHENLTIANIAVQETKGKFLKKKKKNYGLSYFRPFAINLLKTDINFPLFSFTQNYIIYMWINIEIQTNFNESLALIVVPVVGD